MQRCMLDILGEVQGEVHREREIVWPLSGVRATSSKGAGYPGRAHQLSGTAVDAASVADHAVADALEQVRGCLFTSSSTGSGCDEVGQGSRQPLGKALRKTREEARQQEYRRVMDALSSRSSRGGCASQPSSARCKAQRTPRVGTAPVGPRLVGARPEPAPQVVHRHHHHHHHHHYVLDPISGGGLPTGLSEVNVPASTCETTEHTVESSDGSQQCQVGKCAGPLVSATRSRSAPEAEVEHVHYHHHMSEETVPVRTQRALAEARETLLKAEQRKEAGVGAGVAGPNVRLPRLG